MFYTYKRKEQELLQLTDIELKSIISCPGFNLNTCILIFHTGAIFLLKSMEILLIVQ